MHRVAYARSVTAATSRVTSRRRRRGEAVPPARSPVRDHVRVWDDPRCGGRLVVRDRLVCELVDLLLAGDEFETLRAGGGGYEVRTDLEESRGCDVSLVGTTIAGRLVYLAVADGSSSAELVALRRRCRAMGGTLRVWTKARIAKASRGCRARRTRNADAVAA